MDKRIIAIGGGEIKNKTTLEIDKYVGELAKAHAGEVRANALFIGTASHDSMPYFNSFRKTYTSVLDIKAEVALIVYGEMDVDRIAEKISKANAIYVGGGDTLFMLEKWKETGLDKLIIEAYNKGVPIAGLSAGAICWFRDMFTDYQIMRGESSEYVLKEGLGILDGLCCPHFNEREEDFCSALSKSQMTRAYGIENDCALEFVNGKLVRSITSGGKAYLLERQGNEILKTEI